jgi:hypothetical protein
MRKESDCPNLTRLCLRIAALILASVHSIPAACQNPAKSWSVDLTTNPDFRQRASVSEVLLKPPEVEFLRDGQIICGFYDGEEVGFDPAPGKNRFHVLEIDGSTGIIGRELGFPSFDDDAKMLPVADGGFVVLAGDELAKFDRGFTLQASYTTPHGGTIRNPDLWFMTSVAKGEGIALYHRRWTDGDDHHEVIWLRGSDLSFIRRQEVEGGYAGLFTASSDRYIPNTPGDSVCEGCIARFLSDQELFVDRPAGFAANRRYEIQTTIGKRIAGGRLEGGAYDFNLSASSDRLVFLQWHYVGRGFFYVTQFPSVAGKVTVLDWKRNKRVAEIECSEPTQNPSAGFTESAMAISPDGGRLAVLLHHTLTVYQLQ